MLMKSITLGVRSRLGLAKLQKEITFISSTGTKTPLQAAFVGWGLLAKRINDVLHQKLPPYLAFPGKWSGE